MLYRRPGRRPVRGCAAAAARAGGPAGGAGAGGHHRAQAAVGPAARRQGYQQHLQALPGPGESQTVKGNNQIYLRHVSTVIAVHKEFQKQL